MRYLEYSEVRRLHIELTSHCNAACPQCDRNVYGAGVNPRLKLSSLSLSDIKKILPPEFCRGLLEITFSGVHGDPMMAPEAFEIVAYLKESGVHSLKIQTNGSMRNAEWWRELGKLFGPDDEITFGIDGLADTHEIYRRGAAWEKPQLICAPLSVLGAARAGAFLFSGITSISSRRRVRSRRSGVARVFGCG